MNLTGLQQRADALVPARLRPIIFWAKRIGADITRNRVSLAAGGIAYFVTLSIAPLAIAFGSLVGIVLDPRQVSAALETLTSKAPDPLSSTVESMNSALIDLVSGASAATASVTTLVGFVLALYASSKVVYGVRMGMNTAFGIDETRSGTVERLISAVVTLVGLVIAVIAVVLLTFVPKVMASLGLSGRSFTSGSGIVDWLVITGVIYVVVRMVMVHGPQHRMRVPWTSPGVLIGTASVLGATIFVGVYASMSSTMGAAITALGTPVVLLLWLYLCFLGLLVGAAVVADSGRSDVPAPEKG